MATNENTSHLKETLRSIKVNGEKLILTKSTTVYAFQK